jgi:hypothetical protein
MLRNSNPQTQHAQRKTQVTRSNAQCSLRYWRSDRLPEFVPSPGSCWRGLRGPLSTLGRLLSSPVSWWFMRVERIWLSWDLRASLDSPIILVGRRCEERNPLNGAETKTKITRYRWMKASVKIDRSKPLDRVSATGYYLHDTNHLVGEVGMTSTSRWAVKVPLLFFVTSLVEALGVEDESSRVKGWIRSMQLGPG